MKNLTLNDPTHKCLLEHLSETELLLKKVASKLSNREKNAEIIAMPDLCIAHNVTRMIGGFFTGAKYTWDSDVPFIPIDSTVNVCGTAVFKLNSEISVEEFKNRINLVLADHSKYTWNYTNGNHFISLTYSNGSYGLPSGQYMVVHASANEYKNGPNGLYPNPGVWYEKYIQTEYLPNSSRYLRYIAGEPAIRFYEIAKNLVEFNIERNRYFCKSVLGNLLDKEILSIQHYGMPNINTVCIGVHWEPTTYTLLTSPGNPIFLVNPSAENFEGSPHGFGLKLKDNTIFEFNENNLKIGEKTFQKGEGITIGVDAINRCSEKENIDNYISEILKICPGNICGKLTQICSLSKDGFQIWQ